MNQPIYQLKDFPSTHGYHIRRYTDTKHALHFHDCIEITILEKGEGVHVINGTEYYYPMYTFTIMDYRDCHAFFNLTPKNSLYNLMVSPSLVSPEQLEKITKLTADKIPCTIKNGADILICQLTGIRTLQVNHLRRYHSLNFVEYVDGNCFFRGKML